LKNFISIKLLITAFSFWVWQTVLESQGNQFSHFEISFKQVVIVCRTSKIFIGDLQDVFCNKSDGNHYLLA